MDRYNIADRFIEFYRRNGMIKTCGRIWLSLERTVWQGGMLLFYSVLEEIPDIENDPPYSLEIERIRREEDIPDLAFRRLLNHWNEPIMKRHIRERFGKRAMLWLAKVGKDYAGFGWSIIGTPIEPYFFPLTNTDAHLFNFHIFPEYRGRGINPLLVNHILLMLKREKVERAFIETHVWNKAEIRSLEKTYFHKLGKVRKVIIFGKTIVFWSEVSVQKSSKNSHNSGSNNK